MKKKKKNDIESRSSEINANAELIANIIYPFATRQ